MFYCSLNNLGEFLSENYNAQNFPKLPRHLLTDYYRRDNQRKISSNENLKKDYISGSNYYNNTQQQRSSRKPLSSRQTQRDVYIPQYINDRQQSYSRIFLNLFSFIFIYTSMAFLKHKIIVQSYTL